MSRIPLSPPTTGPPTLDGVGDAGAVSPLPSTEPSPDARPVEPSGTRTPAPRTPVPDPVTEVPVPARRAAHALVVMALEVVDRKRAPQHTRGAFPPHLMDMLQTLARTGVPGQRLGPARMHRLHIHPAGVPAADPEEGGGATGTEYEVCATYARGPRLFAVAARIRVTETSANCTALRLV